MVTKSNTKKIEDTSAVVEQVAVAETQAKVYPTTEALIKDGFTTKSARIRKLHEMGMSTGAIAKQETNGLYQHAYNVIKKPLKGKAVTESVAAPKEEVEA
jgi:hypothetical protein